jgi:hypothetical protein
MASEISRAAKALLERRVERFDSRYGLEDSRSRYQAAIDALRLQGDTRLTPHWSPVGERAVLEAEFLPPARIRPILNISSVVLTLLIAASAWAVLGTEDGAALRFLLPMVTVLAVLGFPFVALALSSHRLAEESRIRRALRKALVDE